MSQRSWDLWPKITIKQTNLIASFIRGLACQNGARGQAPEWRPLTTIDFAGGGGGGKIFFGYLPPTVRWGWEGWTNLLYPRTVVLSNKDNDGERSEPRNFLKILIQFFRHFSGSRTPCLVHWIDTDSSWRRGKTEKNSIFELFFSLKYSFLTTHNLKIGVPQNRGCPGSSPPSCYPDQIFKF